MAPSMAPGLRQSWRHLAEVQQLQRRDLLQACWPLAVPGLAVSSASPESIALASTPMKPVPMHRPLATSMHWHATTHGRPQPTNLANMRVTPRFGLLSVDTKSRPMR
ncbi:uncharacterized protein L969DRAFT_369121 [Mixia osmundae IAM 14324]|uniref:uncharacterized protein n=1 Tax=Mixia osmundae (strain CBS 9802 / IAM 14324 / JCM 22182 / KY 12970) TaxID=764103 RepID=UPI0004A54ECE|nr:uncharacterized protein L969DRAFT_369121 [Mixia osmundae IAM 14324]KEI41014.1 hypothetical protein L969DRAFT_369121 [Mixia osmundae IAM 14324]